MQEPPVDMSVDEWCEHHSSTKANYYYRMKQLHIACLDALREEVIEHTAVSVPMEVMALDTIPPSVALDNSYIELSSHGVTLRITEDTSDVFLRKVLGVLAHVE